MSVRERNAAPWRHPALAPVYAAVIAFVAVLVAGLVIGRVVTVTVTLDAAILSDPHDLSVQLQDRGGQVVGDVQQVEGGWTATVEPGQHRVCVLTTALVRLAGVQPADRCVPLTDEQRAVALALEPVRVAARFVTGPGEVPPEAPPEAKVLVLDAAGGQVAAGPLDATGGQDLHLSAAQGDQVCLLPPPGWRVVDPPATSGRPACRPTEQRVEDVVFTLEAAR